MPAWLCGWMRCLPRWWLGFKSAARTIFVVFSCFFFLYTIMHQIKSVFRLFSNIKPFRLRFTFSRLFYRESFTGHSTVCLAAVHGSRCMRCNNASGLSLRRLVLNLKSVALTVFELLAFNSHHRTLRTHKQTHIERTHYLRHSLRSLGGDKYLILSYPSW